MVNVAQSGISAVNGTAQNVRASAGLTESISKAAQQSQDAAADASTESVIASVDRAYRYNSFEFSYRQDFGKIVLLRQKPDTGEVVQQFPSEYYLRKYAASQRIAQTAASAEKGPANAAAVDKAAVLVVTSKAALVNTDAQALNESAAPLSTPSLSRGPGFAPINLTI